MPIEIKVPRLGWSMDEGTLAEWLVKEGEFVSAGEMLFVLEGDKAAQEIESFDAGFLHLPANAPQPGDTVVVGQVLGYLLAEGEAAPSQPVPAAPQVSASPQTASASSTSVGTHNDYTRTASQPAASTVVATPRARRKARELGVSWSQIPGTGRNGRVRERDVVAASRGPVAADPGIPGRQQQASPVRRTIAQRMLAGVQQTAPVTLTTKVRAEALFGYRQRLRTEQSAGEVAGYTDLLVRLVAAVLPDCPALNACWRPDGVFLYDEVNIAIAVDTGQGLLAPVLKNAAKLSLNEITTRSRSLVERARGGHLAQDELQGGTFTITNLGMFDIDFFTPILNLPQTAVLGVGRIVDEPVVDDGQVVAGKTLGLSLTFDHRVIDGAPAARWLQQLANQIERIGEHGSCIPGEV